MNQIVMNLTLDLAENESRKSVRVVQGDAGGGKFVLITLTNNGEVVEITEEADEAKFYAGINGELIANGTPVAISGNKIHIPININCTSRAGTVNCTVQIESSSGIAHSAKFDIIVASNPAYDVPASSTGINIYDAVDSLTSRMTAAENDIDDLESDVGTLNTTVAGLTTTVSEHTTSINKFTQDLANAIKHYSMAMFPEYDITRISTTGGDGGLTGLSPDFMISTSVFDSENDGLLIWKNGNTLIPKPLYGFSDLHPGAVTIEFHVSAGYFAENDTVVFEIYKKKNNGSIVGYATLLLDGVVGAKDSVGIAANLEE